MKGSLYCLLLIISVVCVFGQNNVFISDPTPVQVPLVAELGQARFDSVGNRAQPTSVYTTYNGVYVANSANGGSISFYTNPLLSIGATPSLTFGAGSFNTTANDLLSIVVDANGNVYVAVYEASALYVFRPPISAQSTPILLSRSFRFSPLLRPSGLAINPINNNLFVVDSGNSRVLEFDSGLITATQTPRNVYGANNVGGNPCRDSATVTCFYTPTSVSIDCYGGVWISAMYSATDSFYSLLYFASSTRVSSVILPRNFQTSWSTVTSIAWGGNCSTLAVVANPAMEGASSTDPAQPTQPGQVYLLQVAFANNRLSSAIIAGPVQLGKGTNNVTSPTSDSFGDLSQTTWDVSRPGFFWVTDISNSRVTLQSTVSNSTTLIVPPTPSSSASPV